MGWLWRTCWSWRSIPFSVSLMPALFIMIWTELDIPVSQTYWARWESTIQMLVLDDTLAGYHLSPRRCDGRSDLQKNRASA